MRHASRESIRRAAEVSSVPLLLSIAAFIVAGSAFAGEPLQAALQPAPETKEAEPRPSVPGIALKMLADEKIPFSGEVNYDKAGLKGPNMLYGPGLVGFFAVLATHGVMADKMKDNQKQKLRDDANQILKEYEPLLDNFKYPELATASLEMMAAPGKKSMIAVDNEAAPNDTIIDSRPQFSMTQDQRAIILDNPISIAAPGNPTAYRVLIRVVSRDAGENAPNTAWTEEQGRKLKSESERLFAASLDIALNAMGTPGQEEGAYKTVRFQEGGTEKMERGQVIHEDCSSIVFKTLRGELMSVPAKGENCTDKAANK